MSTQQQQLAAYQQVVANIRALYPNATKEEIKAQASLYQMKQKGLDEAAMERKLTVRSAKANKKQEEQDFLRSQGFVSSVVVPRATSDKMEQYHDWARRQRLEGSLSSHQSLVSEAKARYATNPEEFRSPEDIKANPVFVPTKKAARKQKEFVPIEGIEDTLASLSTMMNKKANITNTVVKNVPVNNNASTLTEAARKKELLRVAQAGQH